MGKVLQFKKKEETKPVDDRIQESLMRVARLMAELKELSKYEKG